MLATPYSACHFTPLVSHTSSVNLYNKQACQLSASTTAFIHTSVDRIHDQDINHGAHPKAGSDLALMRRLRRRTLTFLNY